MLRRLRNEGFIIVIIIIIIIIIGKWKAVKYHCLVLIWISAVGVIVIIRATFVFAGVNFSTV